MEETTQLKLMLLFTGLAISIGIALLFVIDFDTDYKHGVEEIDERKYTVFNALNEYGDCPLGTTNINSTHCIRFQ